MWKLVYGSVRGTSHVHSGQPCQDSLRGKRRRVDAFRRLLRRCRQRRAVASGLEAAVERFMEEARLARIRPDTRGDRGLGGCARVPASWKRRRPTDVASPACLHAARRDRRRRLGGVRPDRRRGHRLRRRGRLRARLLAGQRRVREHHPVPDRRRLPRAPADRDRRAAGHRAGCPHRRPSDARPRLRRRRRSTTGSSRRCSARCETARTRRRSAASLLDFMDSKRVNDRTDDDKTLLLATRNAPMSRQAYPTPTT